MPIPNRDQALALLNQYQAAKPERIAHSLAVADLASTIGLRLNHNGAELDLELVESAAILHDILKGQPAHDHAGGQLLRTLGYPEVAEIIEVHTRLGGRTPAPDEPIGEAEVVYIADKSYRRTNRVSIEERYAIWKNTWKDDPKRLESLTRGENRAKTVRERIEKALGKKLEEV